MDTAQKRTYQALRRIESSLRQLFAEYGFDYDAPVVELHDPGPIEHMEKQIEKLQADNKHLASLAEVLLNGNSFPEDRHRELMAQIRDLRVITPREAVVKRECLGEMG